MEGGRGLEKNFLVTERLCKPNAELSLLKLC